MFFLRIRGWELKEIVEIASKSNFSLERATREVFARGLKLLKERASDKTDKKKIRVATIQPVPSPVSSPVSLEEQPKVERRGRKRKIDKDFLDKFIQENWQKMTDGEIAKKLEVGIGTIHSERLSLGLKRTRGKESGRATLRSQINPEWLRKALLEEGLTPTNIAREFNVSRERIRHLQDEFLIKLKDKTPLWYANRMGKPELADKKWLESELAQCGSISALAAKTGVSELRLRTQAERLGINPDLLKPHGELVELTCSECGNKFFRKKVFLKNPNQKLFFCSKICQGKFMGKRSGIKKRRVQGEEV